MRVEAPAAEMAMTYGLFVPMAVDEVEEVVVEVTCPKASINAFMPFSQTCGSSTDIFLRSGLPPMPVIIMSTRLVESEGCERTGTRSDVEWALPWIMRREGEESSDGERRA